MRKGNFCTRKNKLYIYSHFMYMFMCVYLSLYVSSYIFQKATNSNFRERYQESERLEKREINIIFKNFILIYTSHILLGHTLFYFKR